MHQVHPLSILIIFFAVYDKLGTGRPRKIPIFAHTARADGVDWKTWALNPTRMVTVVDLTTNNNINNDNKTTTTTTLLIPTTTTTTATTAKPTQNFESD